MMFHIFPIIFLIMAGIFVYTIIQSAAQWNKNNHSPVLTVEAHIISKRMTVTHHPAGGIGGMGGADGLTPMPMTSQTYYVTFQVESGDRMEFMVNGKEYGLLAEGDTGKLTFQGTRYIQFERVKTILL